MKTKYLKNATLTLLPAAMLALASCSSIPGEETTSLKTTGTSTTVVETFKATATVTSIDTSSRKLKLTLSNGKRTTVKCGPDVVNFNQIRVNDRVNVVMIEEIAAYLDKGATPGASDASAVALSPRGAKPGVVMAETTRDTVKITDINTSSRRVKFVDSGGNSESLKVGDHIDLTKVKVGDSVTIRQTEAVALTVEKP